MQSRMRSMNGVMADMERIIERPGATAPHIMAMTVLTLLALGGGIIVATVIGRWTMELLRLHGPSSYSSALYRAARSARATMLRAASTVRR